MTFILIPGAGGSAWYWHLVAAASPCAFDRCPAPGTTHYDLLATDIVTRLALPLLERPE